MTDMIGDPALQRGRHPRPGLAAGAASEAPGPRAPGFPPRLLTSLLSVARPIPDGPRWPDQPPRSEEYPTASMSPDTWSASSTRTLIIHPSPYGSELMRAGSSSRAVFTSRTSALTGQ
jgi:hypothetical protein